MNISDDDYIEGNKYCNEVVSTLKTMGLKVANMSDVNKSAFSPIGTLLLSIAILLHQGDVDGIEYLSSLVLSMAQSAVEQKE